MDSVRYGIIGSFITKREIAEGEEIFSNYGPYYADILIRNPDDQPWYYDSWQDFKKKNAENKEIIESYENAAKKVL